MFAGIETDKAIGASLAIIAINSAFGFLGHLREAEIDWKLTSFFVLATLPGLALGAWFSSKMSKQRLNHVFAWLVVTAAVAIAAVNLWEPVARS